MKKATHPATSMHSVLAAATVVLGSEAAARRYLATANFALRGAMPLEMLKRPGGEEAVISELQAQGESGPL